MSPANEDPHARHAYAIAVVIESVRPLDNEHDWHAVVKGVDERVMDAALEAVGLDEADLSVEYVSNLVPIGTDTGAYGVQPAVEGVHVDKALRLADGTLTRER